MAIIWEFLDIPFSMEILQNRTSVEGLSSILVAAAIYEEELGDVGIFYAFNHCRASA